MKWLNILRNTCFVNITIFCNLHKSLASNWDHLFPKTTRLFLQYHAWDVIYQHKNLVVLDWLHWSIIKLVQVTLSIPKMPLAWIKYKLFFQHFNEKLQIRLNANLFGNFESHLRNQHNVAFQRTKIIKIIISVCNVLCFAWNINR